MAQVEMAGSQEVLDILFRRRKDSTRHTQDSPVYPEVWTRYAEVRPNARVDLLLTPIRGVDPGDITATLDARLPMDPYHGFDRRERRTPLITPWRLARSETWVTVRLSFVEMLGVLLPITDWWRRFGPLLEEHQESLIGVSAQQNDAPGAHSQELDESDIAQTHALSELEWFAEVIAKVWSAQTTAEISNRPSGPSRPLSASSTTPVAYRALKLLRRAGLLGRGSGGEAKGVASLVWSVSPNRAAHISGSTSLSTTKGDAARRVFDVDGKGIRWAVIDTGIDATHPAFRLSEEPERAGDGSSRVWRTRVRNGYDFTRLRGLQTAAKAAAPEIARLELGIAIEDRDAVALALRRLSRLISREPDLQAHAPEQQFVRMLEQRVEQLKSLERSLRQSGPIDWDVIADLLEINASSPEEYKALHVPEHHHGTHVAGILGARSWGKKTMEGMCPGIELVDLRAFGADGSGEEFAVLAALQFIRWLNRRSGRLVIHGVNLSLSIPHRVESFACGRTPICDECNRLVEEGVVVVAAAGNRGVTGTRVASGFLADDYKTTSITDPGNAEDVITVGATHRSKPHTYGVSYFSSRGPTADGRLKPDLLAPGEKIMSAAPGEQTLEEDGTSMAAPHVSGVAAQLLCKHREFIGQPRKIKNILCATATDLGRERYFQGHGLVDALRALQHA